MRQCVKSTRWAVSAVIIALLSLNAPIWAQSSSANYFPPAEGMKTPSAPQREFNRTELEPEQLKALKVEERAGESLPLDVVLTNEFGKKITLSQYFASGRPVIINLGYFGCPMLCGLVTNGLLDVVKELSFTPGQEFDVITLSIDPAEKYPLAMEKKKNIISALGKNEAAAGWHFLTGNEESIKAVADAVGFKYRWDPVTQQFAHPALLVLATPDGRVSRYLYGVKYNPRVLRLSLVEASNGKFGNSIDQILLFCFHYDPTAGKYSIAAMNLMRLGGVMTVIALASLIGFALLRERQRSRLQSPPDPTAKVA